MRIWNVVFVYVCIVFVGFVICFQSGKAAAFQDSPTITVLYNLGSSPDDPRNPVYPGVLAEGRDGNIYSTSPAGGANDRGTVFEITAAGTLTVLYSFDVTHGAAPQSGLALGADGNFYGTALQGGDAGYGCVFKITPTGTLTVLYNFTNGIDGAQPYAAPIQGSDGNFYGTTTSGGAAGFGTVYRITPSGKLTTVYAFGGSYTNPIAPLVQGTDGNFYGTSFYGGASGLGNVFRVWPSGAFQVLYNFNGPNGSQPFGSLIQGSDGNFYGNTSLGSTHSSGLIFKLTPSGALTLLHAFGAPAGDGSWPYGGVIQASDGNLYGTTAGGGIGDGFGIVYELQLTQPPSYSILVPFTPALGENPQVSLLQHSNGVLYGATNYGGSSNQGTIYSLDLRLPAFAHLVSTSGQVGSAVEILGQGFTSATTVSFGGKTGSISSRSGTYLTATVPSGALTAPITVSTGSATLTSNQLFRVIPNIKSFGPSSGPVGKDVILTGTGFTQTFHVSFGGVNASSFTVNSDSQVTVRVPSGSKTGTIAVATQGGSAVSPGSFTVTGG